MAALAVAASGCTSSKVSAPSLTGPSTYGLGMSLTADPQILTQDGISRSAIDIRTLDQNGSATSASLKVAIQVNGVTTDFGSLSAHSVATDSSGQATVSYTAPAASTDPSYSGSYVTVVVTPNDTRYPDSPSRSVNIHLVPSGTILPPVSFTPAFTMTPSTPGAFDTVAFDASSTTNPNNNTLSYAWTFGDGSTATGVTASHSYSSPGSYSVTLTVTNANNQSATVTKGVTVGASTATPKADFVFSPTSPTTGQTVYFNASGSAAGAGHTLKTFNWDFGDGHTGTGVQPSHAYSSTGTFTVTLSVADEVGQQATKPETVTVGALTASFTVSPSSPAHGSSVTFTSTSQTTSGHTITSVSWNFGDGTASVSGSPVTHTFTAAGTYTVTLTVQDDAGNSTTTTQSVTVS